MVKQHFEWLFECAVQILLKTERANPVVFDLSFFLFAFCFRCQWGPAAPRTFVPSQLLWGAGQNLGSFLITNFVTSPHN